MGNDFFIRTCSFWDDKHFSGTWRQICFKFHNKSEGYSSLKKDRKGKSVEPIEEHKNNSKGKSIKAKEKVCSSN